MTKKIVADEHQLGILYKRFHDLYGRVKTGSVSFNYASSCLQLISENRIKIPINNRVSNKYHVKVNYSMSIEKMVQLGNYDIVHPNINSKNFPTVGRGEAIVEMCLFQFDRVIGISSMDVFREMDNLNYRAAEIHELLAFGVGHPDIQREASIIALGSIANNTKECLDVACLSVDGSLREVSMRCFNMNWGDSCFFLAVHK